MFELSKHLQHPQNAIQFFFNICLHLGRSEFLQGLVNCNVSAEQYIIVISPLFLNLKKVLTERLYGLH